MYRNLTTGGYIQQLRCKQTVTDKCQSFDVSVVTSLILFWYRSIMTGGQTDNASPGGLNVPLHVLFFSDSVLTLTSSCVRLLNYLEWQHILGHKRVTIHCCCASKPPTIMAIHHYPQVVFSCNCFLEGWCQQVVPIYLDQIHFVRNPSSKWVMYLSASLVVSIISEHDV